MADESLVGQEGQPFTMRVELGKVREFARACESRDPAYLEGDEPVTPPTFLMASAFWQGPGSSALAGAKLNLARVLHGGQEFVFHGPPPKAGATLVGTQRIAEEFTKEGGRGGSMRFIKTVTEFRDEAGALVAESHSTVIETGKATTGGA